MDFIESQRFAHADLAEKYGVLSDLQSKKLWHQLTIALLEFVRDPRSNKGDNLIQLYEKFISSFEGRINQLQFVLILAQIATQYYPTRPYVADEVEQAAGFLGRFVEKAVRLGPAALLVLRLEIASLRIKKAASTTGSAVSGSSASATATKASTASGSGAEEGSSASSSSSILDGVKKDLAAAKLALDALPDGEDPVVPGTYYRVASEYFKLRGPASSFYEHSLLYLGYAALDTLSQEAQYSMAVDVAVAALVGDGVFNFGEVNAQPVLASLKGTRHAWLRSLLAAFQTGDIDAFEGVLGASGADFDAQEGLGREARPIIKEKITLLALMEMAARRPATDRSLAFADIARETRCSPDRVETLAMRAMSLGLIKGRIDEVTSFVHVSFVKPRVLDNTQIAALKEKVDAWRQRAATALTIMEEHTSELLT